MPQKAIDYAALAEKARQQGAASAAPPAVDYAALAQQARGGATETDDAGQARTPDFSVQSEGVVDRITGHLRDQLDTGIGAVKEVGSTALNIADLVSGRRLASYVMGGAPSDAPVAAAQQFLKPSNSNQELGATVAKIGMTVAPGGAITRLGKGAAALAPAVRGAPTAARAAVEGASLAGLTAAQGGDMGDVATGAVLGAAIPVAGAMAGPAAARLRASAEKKVAQALGATKEKFKDTAQRLAPRMLERGIRGSREQMLDQAKAQAKEAGKAVNDVFEQHGDMLLPSVSVIDALETAKDGYMVTRTMSVRDAMRHGLLDSPGATLQDGQVAVKVALDSRPIEQLTKLQDTVRALGDDIEVRHWRALRQAWDGVVDRAGGFAHRRQGSNFGLPLAEQSEAWAKKEGRDAIATLLNQNVPDAAAVNKEFAFWADLRGVLRATQARTQAQGPGLNRVITGTVGATGGALGAMQGEDPAARMQNAVAYGVVAPMLFSAVTSPRWRMVSAGLRNQLADAMMSDSPGRVVSALTRIAAVTRASDGPSAAQGTQP